MPKCARNSGNSNEQVRPGMSLPGATTMLFHVGFGFIGGLWSTERGKRTPNTDRNSKHYGEQITTAMVNHYSDSKSL